MALSDSGNEIQKDLKKKREPITTESVTGELDSIIKFIDKEIDKRRKSLDKNKGTKALRSIRKRVEESKKHVAKIKRGSRSGIPRDTSKSGLLLKYNVTPELANFLHIDRDEKLSRSDVQCALSAYINLDPDEKRDRIMRWKHLNENHRDLRDNQNRRIINPDKPLSQLLNYEQYKKDVKNKIIFINNKKAGEKVVVTDDRLQYYVIMRLIQKHFV